jgi:hypothetical protein
MAEDPLWLDEVRKKAWRRDMGEGERAPALLPAEDREVGERG